MCSASAMMTRSSMSQRRWARSMRDSMELDIGWPSAVTRPASWRWDRPRSVRSISMVRAARTPAGPISRERTAVAPVLACVRRFGEPAIVVYVPPHAVRMRGGFPDREAPRTFVPIGASRRLRRGVLCCNFPIDSTSTASRCDPSGSASRTTIWSTADRDLRF